MGWRTMNFQDGMKLSVSHRRLQTPICRLRTTQPACCYTQSDVAREVSYMRIPRSKGECSQLLVRKG